jgi:hypothetical protein
MKFKSKEHRSDMKAKIATCMTPLVNGSSQWHGWCGTLGLAEAALRVVEEEFECASQDSPWRDAVVSALGMLGASVPLGASPEDTLRDVIKAHVRVDRYLRQSCQN